ncbi:MAG: hypothetical protein RDV48_25005 [Candidatus Eremiobacteraeota bacterium]|nr:hypothetical protein [Candidatus Eremiobacteraeota bacterium]
MAFGPFNDFEVSEETLAEFKRMLAEDPLKSLVGRFMYFVKQNPDAAQQGLTQ